MNAPFSLSNACTVYKKIQQSPKRKKKSKEIGAAPPMQRILYFNQVWDNVRTTIKSFQDEVFSKVLEDLISFLKSGCCKLEEYWTEIPTAVLVTGVNIPDHDILLSILRTNISKCISPFVACLSSNDASNTKNAIQKVIGLILENSDKNNMKMAKSRYTPSLLASWYKECVVEGDVSNVGCSPAKKARKGVSTGSPTRLSKTHENCSKKTEPIVIILEDFEKLPALVIQDLIRIFSNYANSLPIVFVFCVSTSSSTVQELLTHSSLSKLTMKLFQSECSQTLLDCIMTEILIKSTFPFRLGNNLLSLLEESFLSNNLSVKTFINNFKFCMLEYFYSRKSSVLCGSPPDFDSMEKEGFEEVRKFKSFRKYVEVQEIKAQKGLLQSDNFLKGALDLLLLDLKSYHRDFYPVLKFVFCVVKDLPTRPLGNQLRKLYGFCLDRNVAECKEFEECMKMISFLSKSDLLVKLDCGIDGLASCEPLPEAVQSVKEAVIALKEKIARAGQEEIEVELESKAKYLDKSRKQLLHFRDLREEVIQFLRKTAEIFLRNYRTFPLHEIFYFDEVKSVKSMIAASPRSAIQDALSDPAKYLQCDCCQSEDPGVILPTIPDICIAYKLQLECGRLVNFYDWLQSFITVIQSDDSVLKDNEKCKLLTARFARAVSELQFLGFVKPTQRKTDHIARLAF